VQPYKMIRKVTLRSHKKKKKKTSRLFFLSRISASYPFFFSRSHHKGVSLYLVERIRYSLPNQKNNFYSLFFGGGEEQKMKRKKCKSKNDDPYATFIGFLVQSAFHSFRKPLFPIPTATSHHEPPSPPYRFSSPLYMYTVAYLFLFLSLSIYTYSDFDGLLL